MFSSNPGLLLTEVCVYAFAIALALVFPRFRPGWLIAVEAGYMRLANRRWLSVFVVIAIVLVLRGALIPFLPMPVAGVNDEFSYLLAGETFASGHMANPPHALWKSLETLYVLPWPTYSSMYPPAQGLALAAGNVLGGHPWFGVYLSAAFMCGAICWMLQAWVPLHWALMGGILAALRWGVYS
jgi:hypothetical protein